MAHNLTLYRRQDGELSFYPLGSVGDVPAELAPGYRVAERMDGQLRVFSFDPSRLAMGIVEAIAEGAIKLL